jgi:hypothetical protein
MIRSLAAVSLGVALLSGCGDSPSKCREALTHAMKIYQASDAPEEMKKQARDDFELGVKACEKEKPPAGMFDCTLAAKTVDDLKACDKLR